MTGNQLNVAIALLQQNGFSVGDVKRVEREAPANDSARAGPRRLAAGRPSLARLRFPHLLLLEAEGDADRQRRPGQRQGALDRRPDQRRSRRKTRRSGLRSAGSKSVHSEARRRRAGDPLRTLRRGDRDQRQRRSCSSSPAGRSWPRCRSWSARSARVAVQQIRGRGFVPSVEEEESTQPAGRGDPPGAERRLAARHRARPSRSSSPRAKKRRRCRT